MLTVREEIQTTETEKWTFEAGENRHGVFHSSFGYKTRRSNRKTWNKALIIAGPVGWSMVETRWAEIKMDLGRQVAR